MDNNLHRIAEQRSYTHIGHASQRILSENYNLIGVCGEDAFAKEFNLEIDDSVKPAGDNGTDFFLGLHFSVDVKTAKLPYNLLLEVGKPVSDIYVLADYNDGDTKLVGWEWGRKLSQAPTKDFGYGVINHYIPAENLRPMSELKRRAIEVVMY